MILYVDETGNDEYFIVAGLLVNSDAEIELAYKRFKNKVKGFKVTPKYKSRIFTEFKSTWLDNDQQRMKIKMLEEVYAIEGSVIYSCYMKRNSKFNQVILTYSNNKFTVEDNAIVFEGDPEKIRSRWKIHKRIRKDNRL